MAPFHFCSLLASCNNGSRRTLLPRLAQAESQLKTQWQSPSDILSLLLILGPEVVQRALAQVTGTRYVPVAFSFGWVAYSFTALLAVAGDGHVMPEADSQALIINAKTGHQRDNKAWIVGRLLRDFSKRAVPFPSDKASPDWEALRVSVFKWHERKTQSIPDRDWIWYSGLAVIVLQISIAIIPLALSSEWPTLVLVTTGILLASAQAALPQWRSEKWACPVNGQTISVTQGNGHRHVMVLLGSPKGLDLEILAAGSSNKEQPFLNKVAIVVFTACWTVFLITVAGLKQGSWYLLVIGAIGMIQNVIVAGFPRLPDAFGLHLIGVRTIKAAKVSKALMKTEQCYPGVGTSLIPVFNPGGFRVPEDEADFWHSVGYDAPKQEAPRTREAMLQSDLRSEPTPR